MTPLSAIANARPELRAARPGDVLFLFEVYASTRADELAAVNWTAAQKENFLRMQFTAQDKHYRENYPGAEFHVISAAGQPVGRLYLHRREDEIRIMDIALLPAWRGRGLGTVLLRAILEEGQQTGKAVSIHVEIFNPALQWYERLGFRKSAEYGPYHLMEWTPAPATISRACQSKQEVQPV